MTFNADQAEAELPMASGVKEQGFKAEDRVRLVESDPRKVAMAQTIHALPPDQAMVINNNHSRKAQRTLVMNNHTFVTSCSTRPFY